LTEPAFPGGPSAASGARPPRNAKPTPARLIWEALTPSPEVLWRADIEGSRSYGPSVLELHLLPTEPVRVEVRGLASLGNELLTLGRSRGMFSMTEGVNRAQDDQRVLVSAEESRESSHAGLCITRNGQVSGWVALPRDSLGSVLDPDDLRARMQALLETLCGVDIRRSRRVAFAVGVEPADMLTSGRASDVGHRSQASIPLAGRGSLLRVVPDDALAIEALSQTGSIAEELAARLLARYGAVTGE
jgi:hypothetical protein